MTTTTARRAAGGRAAAVLVLVGTLAACGGDGGTTAEPDPTPSLTSPTPEVTPAPAPTAPEPSAPPVVDGEPSTDLGGFTAPGTELTSEGDAAGYVVTEVRAGHHDGYDRVVYELTGGQGVPGYRIGYVDAAIEDPSGQVRDVDGDAILQVWLIGTTYPVAGGAQEFSGDLRPADGDVEHVVRPLTFEAMTQSFVGVDDAPRPVRVTVLADPVRVVVDLQDD